MTARVDRALVRAVPLFEEMPDNELDDVLTEASSRRYPAGSPVFEQEGAFAFGPD